MMKEGAENTNSYEGTFTQQGGDIIYRPKQETDPAEILKAAQTAVISRGGYEKLGRVNLHIDIPGRGYYHFDENTTVADFDAQDRRSQVMAEVPAALADLTPDQIKEVIVFAKKLKS